MRKPEEPSWWIAMGVVITLFGGGASVAAIMTDFPGFWIMAGVFGLFGAVLTQAGVIAVGVRLGMRWSRWEQRREIAVKK